MSMDREATQARGYRAWIQTVSGKQFALFDPDPMAIDIDDIAHALSMLCRFNGHCSRFYSVAEHSVLVSHEIRADLALVGLIHDAAEAYLGDVASPAKTRSFRQREDRVLAAISARIGVSMPRKGSASYDELKRADHQLLADERSVLMGPAPLLWPGPDMGARQPNRIRGLSPQTAKSQFLDRFRQLTS